MVPAVSGAVIEHRIGKFALAEVRVGPPADYWTLHQPTAPAGSEKIALPAPGIALDPVSQLSLGAFPRAWAQQRPENAA